MVVQLWKQAWLTVALVSMGQGAGLAGPPLSGPISMTRMEIELPDDVAGRLTAAATTEEVAPEALAGKALCESFPVRRTLSLVAFAAP